MGKLKFHLLSSDVSFSFIFRSSLRSYALDLSREESFMVKLIDPWNDSDKKRKTWTDDPDIDV